MGFDLLRTNDDVTQNHRLRPLGHRALIPNLVVFPDVYIKIDWKRLRVLDASRQLH